MSRMCGFFYPGDGSSMKAPAFVVDDRAYVGPGTTLDHQYLNDFREFSRGLSF